MLNLEQVAFNIIEKRMQKSQTLDETEHLCHCYACCQVTTVFTVQQTETMHEESLPVRKKKKCRTQFHLSNVVFLFGIHVESIQT